MARAALNITRSAKGVYYTLNPLNPDLLARRCNRIDWANEGELSKDKDVSRRRRLLIDVDPKRDSFISATAEEKAAARTTLDRIRAFLDERGWPAPILLDSGNGWHLQYAIDLPAADGGLVERCLKALAARFNTDAVHVDETVFNAARITKLPGTLARKGDHTASRPHRLADVVELPDDLEAVVVELLTALADEAPKPQSAPPRPNASTGTSTAPAGEFQHRLKVDAWLQDRGREFRQKDQKDSRGRTVYVLKTCPFDASHGDPDSCIMQADDGELSAQCFHNSCRGRGWQDFKETIGGPNRDHYDPPIPARRAAKPKRAPTQGKSKSDPPNGPPGSDGLPESNGSALPNEADNDPHRLARVFLWGWQRDLIRGSSPLPPPRFRYWMGEFFGWDGLAYRRVSTEEMRGQLACDIKEEFDRLNIEALRGRETDDEGKPPTVLQVTTKVTSNVMQALSGMVLLPATVRPPAWIEGSGPFPAAEVLAADNLLVHLPSLTAGKPATACHTLNFFSQNCLDYRFDLTAPPPAEWLTFLYNLWPDDTETIAALQEWFGYCLLPDTSQQKILFVVGPKRSGKGTIARVLRALVGVDNTAGPTLAGLGTNFGLWPLLGKTLAIISDARLSGRTDAAAVAERLLSISGEDAVTIDRKNLSQVTVKLAVRFMILTNELPKLNDPSGALVGRMILLRQTRSWYGQEDTKLTDKLLAELPGILLWAVEGYKRLRERGHFVQPASSREILDDLEDLSSPIGAFVREHCETGPDFEVWVRDLFERWKEWCGKVGRKETGNEQAFGRDLRAMMPGLAVRQFRFDGKVNRKYIGLRIRGDVEIDLDSVFPSRATS